MKPIWFILAWMSFVAGIVGAFLPIIPTTPFLILSAFLFSKSSPRFHKWVMDMPLAGEGIRDWNNHRVIRPRAKILCTIMIFLSLGFMIPSQSIHLALKIIVGVSIVSVWLFVISRKSQS